MGFAAPTEIQARAIPLLLEGRDVVGQAQTGTGKTAAFCIPLVERLDPSERWVQALILAPTRELALQIAEEFAKLATGRRLNLAILYGGKRYAAQLQALQAGAQVVVGTPGRVLDHLQRGTLRLDRARFLVLDEADRMLDMGFLPDVERIIRRLPRQRQTALFSATIPPLIQILARRYMQAPVMVAVKPEEATVAEVEQLYYEVAERDKLEGLALLLKQEQPERAMIFCRTKASVDRLARSLARRGFYAEPIHGDMTQALREKAIQRFRRGDVRLLVATDVAARGLDIPDVSHVINFDIPEGAEAYIHRIGRTARAGRTGKAITFVAEWDSEPLDAIKQITNGSLRSERLPIYG